MGKVIIPYSNPINLVEIDPVEIPQYVSKFIDDYTWAERLLPQQQTIKPFYQIWQNNDVVTTQVQNNAGQITAYVVDCDGKKLGGFVADQKQMNKYDPQYFIYELNIALTPYPEGRYMFLYEIGQPMAKALVSEPFYVKPRHEGSLLFRYKHRKYHGKMIYETGIEPSVRVAGLLRKQDPKSKDTMYEDQVLDMTMVKSIPYRVFDLTLEQIPDWMAEIFSWILGCSNVRIDGRYFTKNGDDSKFESETKAFYKALADYNIELRESTNQGGKEILVDEDTTEEVTISLNVDSKGFADTSQNASSSVVSFIDVE